LSSGTVAFVVFVCVVAVAGVVASSAGEGATRADWELAVLLAVAAAVAQLFVVVTPLNQSYHLTPGLIVAAAILLPPYLLAVVVVCQHVPEWIKVRYPWAIQTFNIGNYVVAGVLASVTYEMVSRVPATNFKGTDARFFVAGVATAAVFVAVQHFLLAIVLRFARGHSFTRSGLFTFRSLSMDFVFTAVGVVFAHLWIDTPMLAILALSPLFLLHRTLALPKLEAEARQDPKTELYNARHFTEALDEALARARRLGEPLSLLVADLDLLRDVNNRFGHLAGDAVLAGVARVFRAHVRPGDVAARFGGEEFCILLLDTDTEAATAIAERIREGVAGTPIAVETAAEAIRVTVSIGVATFPAHAADARELLHNADVAAYRAKAHGRNRVVAFGAALELRERDGVAEPAARPSPPIETPAQAATLVERSVEAPRTAVPQPSLNNLAPARGINMFVAVVAALGAIGGLAGLAFGSIGDLAGLALIVALVTAGQVLASDVLDRGTISISAVGSLAGAALFGPSAALPLAVAVCVAEWLVHRTAVRKMAFNAGVLTLSALAGALVYAQLPSSLWLYTSLGALAGIAYYIPNIGLLTTVIALETSDRWSDVLRARFRWLLVYYAMYGIVASTLAAAYGLEGALGLIVFAAPLALVRKAQADYIRHAESSARKLREAATIIQHQNETLVEANSLLRSRATDAMESLAAAIDARDAYTAGHSRRVQRIALAIGREVGLDGAELDAVSFAALFHDVGKLGVSDDVLLKVGPLNEADWWEIRRHSEEGERIIAHLGFLADSTPAIRHHHERFDGSGYPDGLRGEEIPVGARVLHVADAIDSMLSSRVYRPALPLEQALGELAKGCGSQFCPRCTDALHRAIRSGVLDDVFESYRSEVAA
jgi:diguanylate cyclase (GGDEF)-like protein